MISESTLMTSITEFVNSCALVSGCEPKFNSIDVVERRVWEGLTTKTPSECSDGKDHQLGQLKGGKSRGECPHFPPC